MSTISSRISKPTRPAPAKAAAKAPDPDAALKATLNQKGSDGSTRVGLTASSDYMFSQDAMSLAKKGSGAVALADAKLSTAGNQRDDIVLQSGNDVWVASSSRFSVPTGKMPGEGDQLTLEGSDGTLVSGTVKRIDNDGQLAAQAKAAADAQAKAAQAKAALEAQEAAEAQAAAEAARQKQHQQNVAAGVGLAAGLFALGAIATGAAVKQNLR